MILVIDQGTTSTRSIVFGLDAAPVASAQAEFQQLYPRPGWVEHDPETLWRTTLSTAREALRRAACEASDLAAIGIANQRETALIWERATGKPIANAIVWQDRRTAEACAALKAEGAEPQVTAATGLVIDPYFSATKIAWLLDNVAGARAAAERGELAFGTVDTFLAVAPDERRRPRDRRHQRLAHPALRHPQRRLGRRHAAALPRAARAPARSQRHGGRVWRERARTPGRLGPDPGARRRSAERADRPGLRCSPAWSRRPTAPARFLLLNTGATPAPSRNRLLTTVAYQWRGKRDLCARGLDLLGRARRCNGCATASRSSAPRRKRASAPRASPRPRASISCPPSPGSARPIGARTRARSSAA